MKLLVLDGNSILNRAFYGIKLLSTKEGLFTNGIYGFMTMMEKVKEETQPDGIAVAFDLRAPTFRHKAYAGYKAQRKGMPEELASSSPCSRNCCGIWATGLWRRKALKRTIFWGPLPPAADRLATIA